MNGRFLFGKTKRKWGFNLVPHSGTSHGKAVLPCAKDTFPLPCSGNYPLREQSAGHNKTLLVKSPNPWYDNMKNLKGCLP